MKKFAYVKKSPTFAIIKETNKHYKMHISWYHKIAQLCFLLIQKWLISLISLKKKGLNLFLYQAKYLFSFFIYNGNQKHFTI